MQIVIDIPEEVYKQIKDSSTIFRDDEKICYEAVQNGTPLPKGHGRLIDADETLKAMDSWDKFGYSCHDMFRLTKDSEKDYVSYVHYADMVKSVENAPTIIEADEVNEK